MKSGSDYLCARKFEYDIPLGNWLWLVRVSIRKRCVTPTRCNYFLNGGRQSLNHAAASIAEASLGGGTTEFRIRNGTRNSRIKAEWLANTTLIIFNERYLFK